MIFSFSFLVFATRAFIARLKFNAEVGQFWRQALEDQTKSIPDRLACRSAKVFPALRDRLHVSAGASHSTTIVDDAFFQESSFSRFKISR
jgi:hypothetical protein